MLLVTSYYANNTNERYVRNDDNYRKRKETRMSVNKPDSNQPLEQADQIIKEHPFMNICLSLLLSGVAVIFWMLSNEQSGCFSWFIRFTAVLFAFFGIFTLNKVLPESRLKKVLYYLVGYPLSTLIAFFKLSYMFYTIGVAIIVIFIIPLLVYTLINKLFDFSLGDDKLIYFISFFSTLTLISYLKSVVIWVLRVMHLPKSEKNESHYKESMNVVKKINFRAIAYVIGFIAYFLSALDKFYGRSIINFDWWIGIKDVALEGLIAFLAFDACISVVAPKLINSEKNLL